MMPETCSIESVVLYKASDFPYGWQKDTTLLEGGRYVDSCIWDGYLFTSRWRDEAQGLYVIDLQDAAEEPMKITDDKALLRNGGSVFEYGGDLYRPAQYCQNYYGENLAMYRIKNLSSDSYEEEFVRFMNSRDFEWSAKGGHHFNTTVFNGRRVVVMDGKVRDNWINNRTRKFFNAKKSE